MHSSNFKINFLNSQFDECVKFNDVIFIFWIQQEMMEQMPSTFAESEIAQDAVFYISWLRERGNYLQDLHDRFNGIVTDRSRNLREYDGKPFSCLS